MKPGIGQLFKNVSKNTIVAKSNQTKNDQPFEQKSNSQEQLGSEQQNRQKSNMFEASASKMNQLKTQTPNPFTNSDKVEEKLSIKEQNNSSSLFKVNTNTMFLKVENNTLFGPKPKQSTGVDQFKLANNFQNQSKQSNTSKQINQSNQSTRNIFSLSDSTNQHNPLQFKNEEPKPNIINSKQPSSSNIFSKKEQKSPTLFESQSNQGNKTSKSIFESSTTSKDKRLTLQTKDTNPPNQVEKSENEHFKQNLLITENIIIGRDTRNFLIYDESKPQEELKNLTKESLQKLLNEKSKQIIQYLKQKRKNIQTIELQSNVSQVNKNYLMQLNLKLKHLNEDRRELIQKVKMLQKENTQKDQQQKQLQDLDEKDQQTGSLVGHKSNKTEQPGKNYPDDSVIQKQLESLLSQMKNYFNFQQMSQQLYQKAENPQLELRTIWNNCQKQQDEQKKLLDKQQSLMKQNTERLKRVQSLRMEMMAPKSSRRNIGLLFNRAETKQNKFTTSGNSLQLNQTQKSGDGDSNDQQLQNQLSRLKELNQKERRKYERNKNNLKKIRPQSKLLEGRSSIIMKSSIIQQ